MTSLWGHSDERRRARAKRRRRIALVATLPLAALAAGLGIWGAAQELPSLDPRDVESVRIVAADGTLLREVLSREDGRSRWVRLGRISPHLINATLVSEDQRFFEHAGIDWIAVGRALALDVYHGRVVSGGSTLTMQLARLLDRERMPRSLVGKLRQAAIALKLERRLSKTEILWHYLNRAPYGGGTFGVEAASRRFLDKPAAELSVAEAALLAALPRSPSGYSPARHRVRLLGRQRHILTLMLARGRISADQYRRALGEPIAWDSAARPFRAPHLARRVVGDELAARAARIETTIDPELQRTAEAAVRRTVRRLADRGVENAAVIVLDNESGDVLAYVGSADFFDERDSGQVDGTLAPRQPGSTVKPFTYALALEQGRTPASIIADLPVHFATDQGDYHPRNYDDTFHGPVRLRVALASSLNVPAVRTAESVGVERLLDRLRGGLGLRSLDRPARHYGLGLTLGNGEVTLQELTAAYAALARGGIFLPSRLVRRVRSVDGRWKTPPRSPTRRVCSEQVAYLVSHILSDPVARAPAFGRDTVLDVGFPAAVKTGTSKDFRDNWTVGYTPRVTVGVWVGSFAGTSMHRVSGITGAGPLWAEVITAASRARPGGPFPRPGGLVSRTICPVSGALIGAHCEGGTEELFVEGTEPHERCAWHREVALDVRNELLGDGCPEADVERRVMTVYPARYRGWAHARGLPEPPILRSPLCRGAVAAARVRIRFPVDGDRYYIDPDLRRTYQRVALEAQVEGSPPRDLRWMVDGRPLARVPYPYTARWPITPGRHTIVAELPGGERSRPVTVTVQ